MKVSVATAPAATLNDLGVTLATALAKEIPKKGKLMKRAALQVVRKPAPQPPNGKSVPALNTIGEVAVGGVGGSPIMKAESSQTSANEGGESSSLPLKAPDERFVWQVAMGAMQNYRNLGQALAAKGKLYRRGSHGTGLIAVIPNGTWRLIDRGPQLSPIIVDTIEMVVLREDKVQSELPTMAHLNAMLRTNAFLNEFPVVDRVSRFPQFAEDFTLVQPGYHDQGEGKRLLYVGPPPQVANSIETITRFLDVMDFESPADRTNALAAALTVQLRHHFPGQKPATLITANKSQAGKGTLTDFISGSVPKADLLYGNLDWPIRSEFQRQLVNDPETGILVFDNVRLDSAGGRSNNIRSAFIESFITSPEVVLAAPDAGDAIRVLNQFCVLINTNDGSVSPDMNNRSLSSRLTTKGDINERQSPIGDPKSEFLPKNRERIEAELRWMIETWRAAGCPLDETVKHPSMSAWARTIGGILRHHGFKDFLGNYQLCRSIQDPISEALAILAGVSPGNSLTPSEWAEIAVKQSLSKTLFRPQDRDTPFGRERAIGVVFAKHRDETFTITTDTKRTRVKLNKKQKRQKSTPHTVWAFEILEEQAVSE